MSGASPLSRGGPLTPIRALPSSLSARSVPSIPAATETFEPLVKAVLRHRLLYKIFLQSAVFSWLLTVTWILWGRGGVSYVGWAGTLALPVMPSTLACTLATWCLGVLPIVVLRKVYLSVTPNAATSPSNMFHNALNKRSTSHAIVLYPISALCLAAIQLFIAHTHEAFSHEDPRLTFFVKSKKHPFYLNGRVVYLLSSQVFIACAYLLRNLMLDRFTVHWADLSSSRPSGLARILTVLFTTIVVTVLGTTAHIVLFGLARSIALPMLYKLPLLPFILRPFSAHFLRGPWTLTLLSRHWSLVTRTFYCSENYRTVGVRREYIRHNSSGAITSTDPYMKHFAYAELKHLASEDSPAASARRSAFFADQKHNPSMWSCLARDALLTLGQDYQLLLRRGKPVPPPAAPAPAQKAAPKLPATPTPLIRTSVLKASPASPFRAALDTLASDGPFSTAVASTAEASASHLPDLFRSVVSPAPPAAVQAVKKVEDSVTGPSELPKAKWRTQLSGIIDEHAPKAALGAVEHVQGWWRRDRVHKSAEASLPNRQLDALVADVLCLLTCASLTEDRYGVVQRDIPRIIEAVLSFSYGD
ncbi:hypothetical protein A0H81_01680 [Grifola frondosa]|uniref:Nucleoporin NDC1 n=1 Tax=Grifola frondosa TaxID=5627 RepID=A0A1C7MN97_GRIFR|nr:hypothetical protein A0H81_01680 [Grifola frondosa]